MIKHKTEVTPRTNKSGTITVFRGRVRLWRKGEKNPFFNYDEIFNYRTDADNWRNDVRAALKKGDCIKRFCTSKLPVADLVNKTLEVRANSLTKQELSGIKMILKFPISEVPLHKLTLNDIVQYARDLTISGTRKPQTVCWYINMISYMLKHAKASCRIPVDNTCVKEAWDALWEEELIDESGVRTTVVNKGNDATILDECDIYESRPNAIYPYSKIFEFCIVQALRRAALPLIQVKHLDFDKNLIYLSKHRNRKTNKGEPQWSPLRPEARKILMQMGFGPDSNHSRETYIFPYDVDKLSSGFREIFNNAGLPHLQFRDFRRTGISRLDADGFSRSEIASISTHSEKSRTLEDHYLKTPVVETSKKLQEKYGKESEAIDGNNVVPFPNNIEIQEKQFNKVWAASTTDFHELKAMIDN